MPRPKAAKKMKFDSGLISDVGSLANDVNLDDNFRSFMDKGEAVFENEEGRAEVAEGVRNTILQKLRKENQASKRDALSMKRANEEYGRTKVLPLIEKAKASARKSQITYAEYLQALARINRQSATEAQTQIDSIIASAQAGLPPEAGGAHLPGVENAPVIEQPGAVPERPGVMAEAEPIAQEGAAVEPPVQEGQEPPGNQQNPGAEGVNPGGQELQGQAVNPVPEPENVQNDLLQGAPVQIVQNEVNIEDDNSVRERQADLNKLLDLQADIRINAGDRAGFFRSINNNFFAGSRLKSARKSAVRAREEVADLKQQINAASERWIRIREAYRANTFREHYRRYDRLANQYYVFSRSLGQNERTIRDDLQGNGQPEGGVKTSKDIAEYSGEFDRDQINNIVNNISDNPYSVAPELRIINGRQIKEGSLNTQDAHLPIKYHHAMVFQAFAEGIKTRGDEQAAEPNRVTRVRMKLLNDFRGYRSRRQYTNNTNGELQDTGASRAERNKMTSQELADARNANEDAGAAAADMNLVADERGANGAFLRSEKSAKIYSVRRRNGDGSVSGFYDNGEFLSGNYSDMQDMSQSKGVNWDKAGQEETLRRAIRRSDFFRHVNAATIQYYSTYDATNYYTHEIADAKVDLQERAGTANDPAAEAMVVLDLYVGGQNQEGDQQAQQPVTLNLLKDKVRATFDRGDKDGLCKLAISMLSEDVPALWDIAKDIAVRLGGRYKYKADRVHSNGYMMRIGLLEEFGKNRSFDLTDIGGSLMPDKLQIYTEELAAKRDSFFSFTNLRQSFWDGTLLNTISGGFAATNKDLKTMKYEGDIKQVCNDFNMNYAEAVNKSSRNFGIALAPIPGIIASQTGGINKKGEVSSEAKNSMSALGTIQTLIDFVQNIAKTVRQIKMIRDAKQKGLSTTILVMDLLKLIANMLGNLVDFVYWWVDHSIVTGIVFSIGVVKNILEIIANTIGYIRASNEIHKMDSSDRELNTAMTEFHTKRASLMQQGQPVTEETLETRQQKEGLADENNSQARYFLALAKSRARAARKAAVSNIASNIIGGVGNFIGMGSKFAWFNPVAFPFKLAAKAVDFVGWLVGKVHDYNHFTENVAMTMGDAKYARYAGFNDALKRETGIRNKHYLVDLARIFMAIDTHYLIRKDNKSEGESSLAITMMQPFLNIAGQGDERYGAQKQTNLARFKEVKLEKLIAAVGGPSGNWRAVLRSSIMG